MKIDKKGQISVELLLLIAITIIVIISLSITINNTNELNKAMASARTGAIEGATINGLAIYPKESYEDYENSSQNSIMHTKNIKIIKIEKTIQDKDVFNKTRIQLKIYASSPDLKTKQDKESTGDRINYNARKSISTSFNSENISNKLYNPSFTPHYSFTTTNVQWV